MSKWSDREAFEFCERYAQFGEDIALTVYTTRLLGRDPGLVLHGGGNTSVKTQQVDELGRQVAALCVKGSGWDMATIEPEGLPAVCLEPIRAFRDLARMSDETMVNGIRRHLLDPSSPTPSVETLLHAFLPHKFICHTHADAVLALVDQEDSERLCLEVFGPELGVLPYIKAGFSLAKETARCFDADPKMEGLILINHGIVTFGATAREAYERMIRHVARADAFILGKSKKDSFIHQPSTLEKPDTLARHLAVVRGCLSAHEDGIGHQVLQWRNSQKIAAFLALPQLTDLATRGTATPDHMIRTKKKPLIMESPPLGDLEAFKARVATAVAGYVADYKDYFNSQAQARGGQIKSVHPLPVVFLIPGMGLLTSGKTVKDANIAADIYEHTIDIIFKAEMVGRYQPLPDDLLFDMEYWSLQQAKLGKEEPAPMAGKVVLVTGACGGIGSAITRRFARAGASLVLTDLEQPGLVELAAELKRDYGTGSANLAMDITDEKGVEALVALACTRFGGLDVVISNAGIATTQPIMEATTALETSLKINLMAHQYLASAACGVMIEQGLGGCLLFNASKSAFNPGPGFGAYSIAKAGLVALMKQYALEFAGDGIRSLAINADRIRTNIFDPALLAARARARGLDPDAYFRANLLGKEVRAKDVADAFYHLYHSQRSTALVFTVDGGNIAASPR